MLQSGVRVYWVPVELLLFSIVCIFFMRTFFFNLRNKFTPRRESKEDLINSAKCKNGEKNNKTK